MKTTAKKSNTLALLAAGVLLTFAVGAQGDVLQTSDLTPRTDMSDHYATQSLRVNLMLNKDDGEIFRRGEPLNVSFQTNEDAYAVVYHLDVEGLVTILWPTSRFSDGFVFAGHRYRVPTQEGQRLRAGTDTGVGYVHAVVSRYPFDLRGLEVDFHHELESQAQAFYVAGDPYLAMNEVNYAITGLEDPSEYAVSNHVSYYVHERVDHPSYLCFQCHDDSEQIHAYRDQCTLTIEQDYAWQNEWWPRHDFYPVYTYPVYVYVDPWSGLRWTNYWYDPWYYWPRSHWYSWNYHCYDWHHSPHWRYDAHVAYRQKHDRYRPIDRDRATTRDRRDTRTKSQLVRGEKPAEDRLRAVKDRRTIVKRGERDLDSGRQGRVPSGGVGRSTERIVRDQPRIESRTPTRTSPGLRLDGGKTRTRISRQPSERRDQGRSGDAVRRDPRTRSEKPARTTPRVNRRDTRDRSDRGDRQNIRPVQPRDDNGRVWSNRRSSKGSNNRRTSPPPSTQQPRRTQPRKQESVRENRTPSRDRSSRSVNRPAAPRTPQKPSTPPPSKPRSNDSGGKSGSRGKTRSGGGR